MNESRGPRRFSKYQDGVSVKDFLLALTDEKFNGINNRFSYLEGSIDEAKRLMEKTMEGFPGTYMRIGSLEPDITMLKAELKSVEKIFNQMEGKASQKSLVITLVISLISLLITGVVAIAGLMRHFQY